MNNDKVKNDILKKCNNELGGEKYKNLMYTINEFTPDTSIDRVLLLVMNVIVKNYLVLNYDKDYEKIDASKLIEILNLSKSEYLRILFYICSDIENENGWWIFNGLRE